MPIVEANYTCKYCRASLRTYDICKEHEKHCLKEIEERKFYQSRLVKVFENQYMFYAQSVEDVDKCISHNISAYKANYDYEDFNYPCLVLINTFTEYDTYEKDYDEMVEIVEYNKYLRKLENMKGECK